MEPRKVKDGSVLGLVALNNMYWYGAASELERLGYVEEMHRRDRRRGKRRPPSKFKVVKRLPSVTDFKEKVNLRLFTKTMADWFEDARGEIECLYEEMDAWRDGLEQSDGLRESSKFSEVETAADEMRELSEGCPDELPEFLQGFPFFIEPDHLIVTASHRFKKKRSGRAARAYNAARIMEALVEGIKFRGAEYIDLQNEADKPRDKMTKEEKEAEQIATDLDGLLEGMDEVVQRIEQIDFPSMY